MGSMEEEAWRRWQKRLRRRLELTLLCFLTKKRRKKRARKSLLLSPAIKLMRPDNADALTNRASAIKPQGLHLFIHPSILNQALSLSLTPLLCQYQINKKAQQNPRHTSTNKKTFRNQASRHPPSLSIHPSIHPPLSSSLSISLSLTRSSLALAPTQQKNPDQKARQPSTNKNFSATHVSILSIHPSTFPH